MRQLTLKISQLLLALSLITFTMVNASHSFQHQIIAGLEIYLAVMPAEMIRGHPIEHPESEMHSRTRTKEKTQHHILVSVFDAKTGDRINQAKVKARIISGQFTGPVRQLELMIMADTPSYGNFFHIPDNTSYRVELDIQRPNTKATIKAIFELGHA